jgi:hypothetical protein
VEVLFRRRHEWAGWFLGDTVRAMERNGEQKKPDLKTWQRHLL